MQSKVTLTMVDDVKVVVPDSLDLITPYVLREQRDWFEDEIKFLRRALEPGQQVVDIGANYGLYTLSIAKTVGPDGHVWAFEPATATAQCLEASIAANAFEHVTLERCALSNTEGTAHLSVHDQSELNALVRDCEPAYPTEAVRLVTLDGYRKEAAWPDIDFIKIDAEEEEANILEGGAGFFASCSPLVQYEVKAGGQIHLDLVQAYARLGYASYRLVPGRDLLVPFRPDGPIDRYLLNLFACKPDRAAQLARDGWLIDALPEPQAPDDLPPGLSDHALDWRATLATLPYGKTLSGLWERTVAADDIGAVEEALALYALSRDASRSVDQRFLALDCSFRRFSRLAEASPSHPHLASLARVAREYGAREIAVKALFELCNSMSQAGHADLEVPFLAPGKRFETVDPEGACGEWLLAAAGEELEKLQAYSSFYTGTAAQSRLEAICRNRFAGPEMHRRLELLQHRFDLPASAGVTQE